MNRCRGLAHPFPEGKHRASSSEHVDGKETIHRGGWSCVSVSVGGRCVRRRLGFKAERVVVAHRRLSARQ